MLATAQGLVGGRGLVCGRALERKKFVKEVRRKRRLLGGRRRP
jgi:hypothetical protein